MTINNQILKNKSIKSILVSTIILLFISCGKKAETDETESIKTEKVQSIKDMKKETGYAPVNGLKMYYEYMAKVSPLCCFMARL